MKRHYRFHANICSHSETVSTNQHDDANLAEYIHRDVSEIHEYQRAGNGERHRQHDNQRVQIFI